MLCALAIPAIASAGQSFTFLQPGFTQAIYGVSSSFMGGVAFAPDADPWVDQCAVDGSPLTRFDGSSTYVVNGTTLRLVITVLGLHLQAYHELLVDPTDPIITGRYLLVLLPIFGCAFAFVVTSLRARAGALLGGALLGAGALLQVSSLGLLLLRFYA